MGKSIAPSVAGVRGWRYPWIAALLLLLAVAPASAEPVDFVLPDLEGSEIRLSDYRGKWVLVNYWATWCPPCLEEMPELDLFHASHKDKDAVVLGVNLEDIGLARLREFVDEQFISYPVLRGKPAGATELGPVPGMPTSYLITPDGEVVAQQVGTLTAKIIEDFMANYTQRKANTVSADVGDGR